MAINIPWPVRDLMSLYGLPWPDVNEDAFHEIKQPLRDFGNDLVQVSEAIETALRDLAAGNPSKTLEQLIQHCASIRKEYLDPIQRLCNDLAGWPCDATYDAITAFKVTLLGMLTAEVANDAADAIGDALTLGLATPEVLAEAALFKEALSEAVQIGEDEISSTLVRLANQCLDDFVSSIIQPFINNVAETVEGRVESYVPAFIINKATVLVSETVSIDVDVANRLHVAPEAMNTAISQLVTSVSHLLDAKTKLEGAIDDIFNTPDPSSWEVPNPSPSLRVTLKGLVKTIKEDLVNALQGLLDDVVKHFVTLLESFARALMELDEDARKQAHNAELTLQGVEAGVLAGGVTVLSAGGTWVGASEVVDPTSGIVDVPDADRVTVGAATDVAFAASVSASVTRNGVSTSAASATDDTNELSLPQAPPTVTAGSATSAAGSVEALNVKADLNSPAMTAADRGVAQVEDLHVPASHHDSHVSLGQAGSVDSSAHLHAGKSHEHHAPKADASGVNADGSIQNLQAGNGHEHHAPNTDASSVRSDTSGVQQIDVETEPSA